MTYECDKCGEIFDSLEGLTKHNFYDHIDVGIDDDDEDDFYFDDDDD